MKVLLILLRFLTGGMGHATEFGAHDPSNPDTHLACWKELGRKYNATLDDKRDLVIAHRTLPCGTKVLICNPRTALCVMAQVGDRGPFGRQKKGPRKGQFTSDIDLATAVARRIRFNGFEDVWMVPLEELPAPVKQLVAMD